MNLPSDSSEANKETRLTCFKSYDVRGKLGTELNEAIAYRIGRAYGEVLKPRQVVVGGDVRLTSPALKTATIHGLNDAGVDVFDLGMVGTEEVYFATFHYGMDGGIEITASHNPIDYNGLKLVGKDAVPIGRDNGLSEIQLLAESQQFKPIAQKGKINSLSILADYVHHLLTYIDLTEFKPMTIVTNAGNGAAGHVIDAIEVEFLHHQVPIRFVKINHNPDGRFPKGIPNPLLPECRQETSDAVRAHGADLGLAWDGDFDRCFFFDHEGEFIESYYMVGLLAEAFLQQSADGKIVYEPRLVWNTEDIIQKNGGVAVMSKTGHAFIKTKMRAENAIYGGEMSAHHYFRDFSYCDSGMIPWLMVVQMMSRQRIDIKDLIKERSCLFPCSGEINFNIYKSFVEVIEDISQLYQDNSDKILTMDGLSVEFADWRFNLRGSNTEPLLRLNIETKGDTRLLSEKKEQLTATIMRLSQCVRTE